MISIDKQNFLSLRLERQFFLRPAKRDEYDLLFRDISPVNTVGWCEPGRPPEMPPHAAFDDAAYNFALRADRKIVKGHFGGRVGYVAAEALELFACLYRKPIERFTRDQQELLDLMRSEGPLNIGSIKEITGKRVKDITPALRRLQEAFLVFEDQADNEGDRAWYIFEDEFPDVDLARYDKTAALAAALPAFARRAVFFDEEQARRFYSCPLKEIKKALSFLLETGALLKAETGGRPGYIAASDADLLSGSGAAPFPKHVIAVQRNDFLARCSLYNAGSAWDTLYYLLIDGEINGAVCGRFRFGPHDIEDIVVSLPEDEQLSRKNEILDAVYTVFDFTGSPYRRYCGRDNPEFPS